MCHRSQNGTGGGAGPKRPVSLARARRGSVGRGHTRTMWKFAKLISHFEKAPAPTHIQANVIPMELRHLFPLSYSFMFNCICQVHQPTLLTGQGALAATWPMAWEREPLSQSSTPGDARACAFPCSLTQEHTTMWPQQLRWPVAMRAPHTACGR